MARTKLLALPVMSVMPVSTVLTKDSLSGVIKGVDHPGFVS